MNNKELIKQLQEIANEQGLSIKKEVAQEFFNHSYNEVKDFFQDLQNNGSRHGKWCATYWPE